MRGKKSEFRDKGPASWRIIAEAMSRQGIDSLSALAKRSGAVKSSLSNWWREAEIPRNETARKVAAAVGVDFHTVWSHLVEERQCREELKYIIGRTDGREKPCSMAGTLPAEAAKEGFHAGDIGGLNVEMESVIADGDVGTWAAIPILGHDSVGTFSEVTPDVAAKADGWLMIPQSVISNVRYAYAVYVKGESMICRKTSEGDILVVDTGQDVKSGDVALVSRRGEIALKEIHYIGEPPDWTAAVLQSTNPVKPTSEVISRTDAEAQELNIVGKVVRVIGIP